MKDFEKLKQLQMAIRYLPLPPAELKPYIEPIPDPSFIYWLFRYRCANCWVKTQGLSIHEIVPRSRSKKSVMIWQNRVPMCQECHDDYHRTGVTDEKIKRLKKRRLDFLLNFDRKEYAEGTEFYPINA